MNTRDTHSHPSTERLQAFLEGDVAPGERSGIEAHVAGCTRCATELATWRRVFEGLADLRAHRPHEGFSDRVMARVTVPEPLSLAARIRAAFGAIVSGGRDAHADDGRIQEWLDGALSPAAAARIDRHVEHCPTCAHRAEAWRGVLEGLGGLPRLAPSAGFADRVMVAVAAPASVPALPAKQPSAWAGLRGASGRALAVARRFVPRTRRAWAALSGAAVTPVATVGLMAYAVFSHPTLTPGALVSFVWWQLSEFVGTASGAVLSTVLESAETFGLYSLFETLGAAPWALAGGVLVYSAFSALALRVLYKNLFATRRVEGRYAQVTAS